MKTTTSNDHHEDSHDDDHDHNHDGDHDQNQSERNDGVENHGQKSEPM